MTGSHTLNVELSSGTHPSSTNNYAVYVQSPAALYAPIPVSRPIHILIAGDNKTNAENFAEILSLYKIPFTLLSSAAEAKDGALLILPPDTYHPNHFQAASPEVIDFVSSRAGTLLILEQKQSSIALPGGQAIFRHPANLVDLIDPSHPVFSGMSWEQFDTWNNPDHGYVARSYLSPFRSKNALALKGPMLTSLGQFGDAISEASFGKGRIFVSLLCATECFRLDSAAARYLRNLLSYTAGPSSAYAPAAPISPGKPLFTGDPGKDAKCIDLKPYANAGFSDQMPEDKQGGWTDQGDNDFSSVRTGKHSYRSLPFDIIDPAANNGRSCLRVAGTARPYFAPEVKGIAINDSFAFLAFLHTSAWTQKSGNAAVYRVHYADGATEDIEIRSGIDIGDWWCASDCTAAPVALITLAKDGYQAGAYLTLWKNPRPKTEIVSIDFLSAATARGNQNEWSAVTDPVAICLAITGIREGAVPAAENVSETAEYPVLDKNFRRLSNSFIGPKGGSRKEVRMPDGTRCLEIRYNAHTAAEDSGICAFFTPPRGNFEFTELVLEAKTQNATPLRFVIPDEKWKKQLIAETNIPDGGAWQEVRIPLPSGKIDFGKMRGEIYIHHGSWKLEKTEKLPDAEVSIRNLRFVGPAAGTTGTCPVFGKAFRRFSSEIKGTGGTLTEITTPDGMRCIDAHYNPHKAGDDAFFCAFFTPPKGSPKFKELVFDAKTSAAMPLRFVIPQQGWKAQLIMETQIPGGGTWQEIRVPLPAKKFDFGRMQGEIYIHHTSRNLPKDADLPAAGLSLKNLRFE